MTTSRIRTVKKAIVGVGVVALIVAVATALAPFVLETLKKGAFKQPPPAEGPSGRVDDREPGEEPGTTEAPAGAAAVTAEGAAASSEAGRAADGSEETKAVTREDGDAGETEPVAGAGQPEETAARTEEEGDAAEARQPDAGRSPPVPKAAVQPAIAKEEPPVEKVTVEKVTVEKVTVEKVTVEKVTVEIDDRKALFKLPGRYGGTNFVALWNPTGASPGTVSAFSRMGAGLLRFPGGVPCQWYDWEFPLATGWTAVTPQHAYDLAKAAGAALILQTNVATDDPAKKFDSSGRHAAKWVLAARKAGAEVAFWEIGNEPEVDAPKEIKSQKDQAKIFEWYNRKFDEQARAIKAVDPRSRVMGPASTNTWFWWAQGNLEKFMKVHGNRGGTGLVDAVSIHWYPHGHKGSWEEKRGIAQGWTKCMEVLTAAVRKHDTRALPLYVTEWNWAGGQDNTSAMEMRNALGCADIIGMFRRTGVAGHTHFCLQRAKKNWGVLAMKDDAIPENEPTPTFYALKMASLLGRNVLATECSVDEANVMSAYAAGGDDGSLQVMMVNKTENPLSVGLAFSKYRPQEKTADVFELRGVTGGILGRKAVYNGVESPSPAAGDLPGPRAVKWSEETRQEVAPHSLVVLSFRR